MITDIFEEPVYMAIQLHHFLILTDPGAPQAELLTEIGLVEGTSNDHPGQGTANRRFFFSNAMLELAYVRDAEEAVNGPARRLRFVERASEPSASPFALVVSRTTASNDAPFPGWRYYPEYFSGDQHFHVGDNSDVLEEPLCICIPTMPPARAIQPLSPEPFTNVTELRISVPLDRPSPVLDTIELCDRVSLTLGEPHHMEIVFNEAEEGQSQDLRPDLPLVICW